MAKWQGYTSEHVVLELREIEVEAVEGTAIAQACKNPTVAEHTCRR